MKLVRKTLLLAIALLALSSVAQAAYNPVTLSGQIRDASGTLLTANGTVWFELSQPGNCTSGGFAVGTNAITYPILLGVIQNSTVTGNTQITANDDITPAGTYYRETFIDSNGTTIVRRNVSILGPGTTKDIGTLPTPSLPSGTSTNITLPVDITQGGTSSTSASAARTALGIPTVNPGTDTIAVGQSRQVITTSPLNGGGALTGDLTLGVSLFGTGASGTVPASGGGTTNFLRADGSWVPTASGQNQTIQAAGTPLTQRPIFNFIGSAFTIADNGGATRTDITLNQSPIGATTLVGTTRTLTATAPLLIAGGASADLSADRTLSLTTNPAGQTPVGVTRTITATAPITIDGGASADMSANRTIAITNPIPVVNGGTGSTTQNFVDLTTAQTSVVGSKTFLGNNVTGTTQTPTYHQNGNGVGYFEGIGGCCDPAGTLGPQGARVLSVIDGAAANPVIETSIGASNSAKPTTIAQRTTSSTAANEIAFFFSDLLSGGSGERYGMFTALHIKPGATQTGNVVGFTASTYAEAATGSGNTIYAMWPRVERNAVTTRIVGMEIDVFNNATIDAATSDNSATNSTIGLAITGGGAHHNSVALAFQSSAAANYATGIQFDTNSIQTVGLNFLSGSVGVYGIDCQFLAVTCLHLANNVPILSRNAAASADKEVIKLNANDRVMVDGGGAQGTLLGGSLSVARVGLALTAGAGLNSNLANPLGTFLRLTGATGAFSIGGIVAPTDATSQVLTVFNTFAQTMTIVNEDASSTAANRITTLTGANIVLRVGASSAFTMIYDSGTARWIVVSTN